MVHSSNMSVLETLQSSFPASQILLSRTPEYSKHNSTYLAAQQTSILPAAIFLPSTPSDIAKFLKLIKPFTGQFSGLVKTVSFSEVSGDVDI
jgi:hypothetical protein